ncbi:uncharacterized protein EDB91DRAFT_1083167 [Suillus paluster]|uniref:uncharacterized protein n=1 Tax=Suillus paluster TaxID=48578 RepID=UPI001B85DA12|nr:uncharacterized protein EDB91DRAFT_1083167 [Suillus paluster]KAG1737133.1 hypothetical protein EDB91DRAFT_1083167 [Suillus paluster]
MYLKIEGQKGIVGFFGEKRKEDTKPVEKYGEWRNGVKWGDERMGVNREDDRKIMGGQEDRRTGGQEDRRTGGQEDRRTVRLKFTWDTRLQSGTWDMGHGTWDTGHGTWCKEQIPLRPQRDNGRFEYVQVSVADQGSLMKNGGFKENMRTDTGMRSERNRTQKTRLLSEN